MSVQLEAIKFNHDPTSATTDALNIRRNANATQFVTVPEWRRGISVNPEHSVAAYAIEETRGRTITIQAKFSRDDPRITTIEVRAVQPPPAEPPQWWLQGLLSPLLPWPAYYYYYLWYYNYLWQISLPPAGNVLGEVRARQVTFQPNGETGFETFELQNLRLRSRGVGIHNVKWRWQFRRRPGDLWTDLTESNHQIYTVLELPKDPWKQFPYEIGNIQLPWTEVMDYACRWAAGTTTLDDAATRVTRAVNDLGPTVVAYDCPGQGGTHYTEFILPSLESVFNCTKFLERMHGGGGNGYFVNCVDCATIVSTFANILGCDLSQSGMFSDFGIGFTFFMNPVLAIGSSRWQTPCGWPGFGYHEVAWKGACTSNDEVFDACLQVDADPTTLTPTPLLPTNMRFGDPGDSQYRDRLATPAGRQHCEPRPEWTRQRRPVI
jgi:hypothetical protein